ncbi:hypothetical protein EON63_15080, partial [archaeon]
MALQEIRTKRISDYQQRIEQRKKAIQDMEALRLKSVYSLHKQQCFELADTHFKARVYKRFIHALFSYAQLFAHSRHVYMRTNIYLQRKAIQTMYNLLVISRHQHCVSVLHHYHTAGRFVMRRIKGKTAESEHQVKLTILAEYKNKVMCFRRLVRRLKYTQQYQHRCMVTADQIHTQCILKRCMAMYRHYCKTIHPSQRRIDTRTHNYLVHSKYRAWKRVCMDKLHHTHTKKRNMYLGDRYYIRRCVSKAFNALHTHSALARHVHKHNDTVDKLYVYNLYAHTIQQWRTYKHQRRHTHTHTHVKVHAHVQHNLRAYLKVLRTYTKNKRESRLRAYKTYLHHKYDVVYKSKYNKYTVQNILTQAIHQYTIATKPTLTHTNSTNVHGKSAHNKKLKPASTHRNKRSLYTMCMYMFAYWRRWRKWVGG